MFDEICQGCGESDEARIIVEGERLCNYCRNVWIECELDLASADTLPKGQDAQQGLAGTESGAVPLAADAQTASQTPSVSPLTSKENES